MTCKDCKNKNVCKSPLKSFKVGKDGDAWANWCDDFDSVHKTQVIEKDGFRIVQLGSNYAIYIYDATGRVLLHAQCTKEKSKKKLAEMLDFYLYVLTKKRNNKRRGVKE